MVLKAKLFVAILIITFSGLQLDAQNKSDNWPNWRGQNDDGVSLTGTPTTQWSEENNVKWKIPIEGKGLGTPVVWGDQIFITSAVELDQKATEEVIKGMKEKTPGMAKILGYSETTENFIQFIVYSISRESGEIQWKRVVREQYPHEGINVNGSWASASCVTDGNIVIASFGSYGIYCFDLDGKVIWEKDLGDMSIDMTFGEGASPVLYENELIMIWDHEGQSRIHVLDKRSGEEIWHQDRDEGTTWTTPIIKEVNGKPQIIVPGYMKSIGYDLKNGAVIWEITGLGEGVISSPVFADGTVFMMTGYGKVKIVQAVDLTIASSNLENSEALLWTVEKTSSYVPSPLLNDGKLYFLKGSRAQLSCVDARTGDIFYSAEKVGNLGGTYASPISANGYIYIVDRKGNCAVIKEGAEFSVVSLNKLDDNFDASPVVIGKELLLRGHKHLYCISE